MPFDFNPNTKLPGGGRTYRIKDAFLAKYRNRRSRYTRDRIDDARAMFFTLFADNRLLVYQAHDEAEKLKMMADHAYYQVVTTANKSLHSTATSTDTSTDKTLNKGSTKNATGQLTGSKDAVQMDNEILDNSLESIDVNKIPDIFDKNHRQVSQGISRGEVVEDYTVENSIEGNRSNTTDARGDTLMTQKNLALNQFKAHSLLVRRLRTEFLECFSVMFW